MILKILTAKALFASATIGVSGVALAATGTLPAPVQNAVAAVTSQVGIHLPDGGSQAESRAGSSGVSGVIGEHNFSGASGASGTTGLPSVHRSDRALCHALVSGRGAERGAKIGSEAFDRLREHATESSANVAQYCETISAPQVDPSGVTGVTGEAVEAGDDTSSDHHDSNTTGPSGAVGPSGVVGPSGRDDVGDHRGPGPNPRPGRYGDDTPAPPAPTTPPAPSGPTGIEGSSGIWYPSPAPYTPEGPSGPSGSY